MLYEFEELEESDDLFDEFDKEIIEIDYTEETLIIKKKLLRKIWVVFTSTVVIIATTFVNKHDDFDVVLKSTIFMAFLYAAVALAILILIFSHVNRLKYNTRDIHEKLKRFLDIFELLAIVPVFMALLAISNVFIISPSFIDGASMEPNYYDGEDILFWHLNVEYERYDVVILKAPNDNYWIKRIIGLPGDTVTLDSGLVYVNGVEINQDFLLDENGSIDPMTLCRVGNEDYCVFNVPLGEYFVLGDNRSVSDDSRSTNLGYVSEEQLFGKVIFKFNNFLRN
mgnify:CR=1 FL=1